MSTGGRPAPSARRLARFVLDLSLDRVPAPIAARADRIIHAVAGLANGSSLAPLLDALTVEEPRP